MAARASAKRRNVLNLTPIETLERVVPQPSPPSSALINVILEYADIQHEASGGHVVLRLSHKRMKDPVIKSILGRETRRLQDISILWDEAEDEIVRVCDAATGADAPFEETPAQSELDTFELTEAALAYLAAFPKRR